MCKMTVHEENTSPRTTIFVRNLPFETSAQKLEEEFSKFGPVKKAFVVKDKDNASRCRGFGYVQFVLQTDADKVFKSKLSIGSRDLKCSYANKKPKHEKRSKLENENKKDLQDADNVEQSKNLKPENVEHNNNYKDKKNLSLKHLNDQPKNKANIPIPKNIEEQPKSDLQRTLVISGLTTKVKRKNIRLLCEQFGEIENIVYPVSDRAEVTAFVRFKDFKSTIRAVQKITGQKVKKSNTLAAVLLTKEGKFPSKKVQQKSRLIVRNLSFKCEEQDIRDCFSPFGKIIDIKIPTKTVNNKSLKIGCAFVQFDNEIHAKTALEKMNLKEIKGRPVVVDWAVEKEEYQSKKEEKELTPVIKENISHKPKVKNKDKEDVKIKNCSVEEKVDNASEKKEKQEDVESFHDASDEENGDDNDEEENGDDNDEEENADDNDKEENADDNDEEDDNGEVEHDDEKEKRPKKQLRDAKEGKTVFIRNLSYNTNEEEIEEEFEKYGEIDYCKLVVDQQTGRSKGSAFVKFKEVESAEACVKQTSGDQSISIDGRVLVVSLAVTKGKVDEIIREKMDAKKEADKRNLYLAYEGMITRNSPGAEGLSDADLKKREKALMEKKTKLKNPNYFVSRTRLSVRNLPLHIKSSELRDIFLKAVKIDDIKISSIKIMTSKDRKDSKGMPRSLGYGFLDVGVHEHALALLRATNNNPDLFGEDRRPIVEFAVENAKALKIQEFKQKKIEEIQARAQDDGAPKKKSDRQKQRDKRKKRIERYHRKREAKKLIKKASAEENNEVKTRDSKEKSPETKGKMRKMVDSVSNVPNIKTIDNMTKAPKNKILTDIDKKLNRKRKMALYKDSAEKPFGSHKKSRDNEEEKFNSLVNKYKSKLLDSNKRDQTTSSRWFE